MSGILKKIFKFFMFFVLTLIVLTAGLIAWVMINPKSVWVIVEKHFLPPDLKVTWEEIDFRSTHLSGLSFNFALEFHELQIKKAQPPLDFPIHFLRLEASIDPRNSEHKVVIHNWQLRAEKSLRFKWISKNSGKTERNPFQYLQDSLGHVKSLRRLIKLENLEIDVKQFLLELTGGKIFPLSIEAMQNQGRTPNLLKYKISVKIPGQQTTNINSRGQFSLNFLDDDKFQLNGSANLSRHDIKATQTFKVAYSKDTANIYLSGFLLIPRKTLRITARPSAHMKLTAKGAEIDLNIVSLKGLPGELMKIDSAQVHLSSPFDKGIFWSKRPTTLSLSCPIKIFFIDKDMRPPLEKACQCKIPELWMAHVEGQAWVENLLSLPAHAVPALDLRLRLEDVDNKLLSLNSAAQLQVTKELNKFSMAPQIDAQAVIHSFQGLRNFLDAKGVLIPAPLSVLDGTILFQIKGPIDIHHETYTFPAISATRLGSERQKVDIKALAKIHLKSNFKTAQVDVQTLIYQLQLELPPLEPVQGKPRITPDKRILREPKPPPKASQFQIAMDFQIKTVRPGTIHLLSRYFDPYLSLALNLEHSADKTNSGYIKVEPFDIRYLRRKVHVEKMAVEISQPGNNPFLVDGRFRVEQTQYTVFIDVQGPTNKPQISLSSTPYLPRAEIISVLLYDRTSDELISSDAGTVGNVEAAIVDRAIGLFSLWAFASTPIKGFSYNPSTRVYTATIEVANDVTASIGTNWEETTQVELRKRISNHWILTASWAPADQQEATKLVLQWENRF